MVSKFSKKSYKMANKLQRHLITRTKEFYRHRYLFDRFNSLIVDDNDFNNFVDNFINTVFSTDLHKKFNIELMKLKEFNNIDIEKLHDHLNESICIDLKFIRQMLYEYDIQKREKGA